MRKQKNQKTDVNYLVEFQGRSSGEFGEFQPLPFELVRCFGIPCILSPSVIIKSIEDVRLLPRQNKNENCQNMYDAKTNP